MLNYKSTGTPVDDITIGKVVHIAQIEVNQKGAEAAAATGKLKNENIDISLNFYS